MPKRSHAATPTGKNDARDLLSLLAYKGPQYAEKLQDTQRNLEDVCSLMQHKVPLEGLISAQDNRTLQATKSCLKRLHVRVEALANVMEQTAKSRTTQTRSRVNLAMPQKQLHANTTNGHGLTEDKEIAGALNSEGGQSALCTHAATAGYLLLVTYGKK